MKRRNSSSVNTSNKWKKEIFIEKIKLKQGCWKAKILLWEVTWQRFRILCSVVFNLSSFNIVVSILKPWNILSYFPCGVFLDFSKPFDTVNHKILSSKLESYGIRGLPLQLFTSYRTNRKQYTSLGNYLSSMQTVSCGVPQGSSLGPVFF